MKTIYQGRKVYEQDGTKYFAASDGHNTYVISVSASAEYIHGLGDVGEYVVKNIGEAPSGHPCKKLSSIPRGIHDAGMLIYLLTKSPARPIRRPNTRRNRDE